MRRKVDIFDRIVGLNVRNLREERGMSQPRVAEVLNISYQSYQRLESGRVTFTGLTIFKLAELFQVKFSDLVSGTAPSLQNGQVITQTVGVMSELSPEDVEQVLRFATSLKQK